MRNLAPMGHNNPPTEMEMLQERLDGYTDIKDSLKRLASRDIPENIENDDQASVITDYIKAISCAIKTVNEAHKKEKSPFWDCCKAADNWKKDYVHQLDVLKSKASKPLNAFLTKKAEEERQRELELARQKREEAERLAAEAEAHANEGINDTANELMDEAVYSEQTADAIYNHATTSKPSQLAKTRGRASSASQRMVWVGEIESISAIDLEALRPYISQDAMQKAINQAVRNGVRKIRGVNIHQKAQVSVR